MTNKLPLELKKQNYKHIRDAMEVAASYMQVCASTMKELCTEEVQPHAKQLKEAAEMLKEWRREIKLDDIKE